jgi:hypothetical protein
VPIACAVPGRADRRLDPLVGSLAGTVELPVDVSGDPPFDELLMQVRHTALAALAAPEQVRPVPARPPRASVSVCTAPVLASDLVMPGLRAELVEAGTGLVAQELSFEFTELTSVEPELLWGVLQYARDLVDGAAAQALVDRLQAVLAAVAADASRPVRV